MMQFNTKTPCTGKVTAMLTSSNIGQDMGYAPPSKGKYVHGESGEEDG